MDLGAKENAATFWIFFFLLLIGKFVCLFGLRGRLEIERERRGETAGRASERESEQPSEQP